MHEIPMCFSSNNFDLVTLLTAVCGPGTLQSADTSPELNSADDGQRNSGDSLTNSIALKTAHTPPGEFMMGSPKTEAGRKARDTGHKATRTKGFHIGIDTETQAQWKAVMGESANRCKSGDLPVDEVPRSDAANFRKKPNEKQGEQQRLPADAARAEAGRMGNGNTKSTHPVGKKKPLARRICAMHGNVWQCATQFCRSAQRFGCGPDFRDDVFRGFRLVPSGSAGSKSFSCYQSSTIQTTQ
jgi:formylglycine-generating enzyme required for sulfatase activity